jgi:transposase InsO family protein
MTKKEKMAVALFRYSVISDIVNVASLDYGRQEEIIREKCSQKWLIPNSEKTRIGRSCILRWLTLYRKSNNNIESLYPKERKDKGYLRSLEEETVASLLELRKELPEASVALLISEMNQRGLIVSEDILRTSTVYRLLNQTCQNKVSGANDCRKFEAELPNDLWQSDVMHGPKIEIDGRWKKTYLIAIIDDHSRLIPHACFYLSEGLPSYLRAFETALAKRGLPRKLYVDNGPAFRSRHLEYIAASLNIALIHATPYKPQGKGKIERWFKTIRTSFLPGFKGDTLLELNEALELWIESQYHGRVHSATGMTPFARFTTSMECLRPAPRNIKDHFRKVARRKVAKDRTITFNGSLFEAPVPLIGKQVELLYHEDTPDRIEIKWQNKSYGIVRPVDVHVNARVKRDENNRGNIIINATSCSYKGGNLL